MSDFDPDFDLDVPEPPDFPETDYASLSAPDDDFEAYDSLADEPPDNFDPFDRYVEQPGFEFEIDDNHSGSRTDEYSDNPDIGLDESNSFALQASDPVYQERNYRLDQATDPETAWQAYLVAQYGQTEQSQLPLDNLVAARFFGETRQESDQTIYTVNALLLSEDEAMTLGVAAFSERALAETFYSSIQCNAETIPVDQVSQFAEFIAPPGTNWQPLEWDSAAEIVAIMGDLDRDTPPENLDLSTVLELTPTFRYQPVITPTLEEDCYNLQVIQYTTDASQPDPIHIEDSVVIATYPSADLATSAQFSLESVQTGTADLVGPDDIRADQAMLAAARAMAVGNGTLDPRQPLFDDPRFDYRLSARDVVNSIAQDLGVTEKSPTMAQQQLGF